jgi:hypothetical protein
VVSSINIGFVQTRWMLLIKLAIWDSGCRRGLPSRDSSRKTPPSVGSAGFSSPKTRSLPANPRECRRFSHTWKSHRRDRTGWLGRQDSNLGMAESPQVSLWMVCPGRLVYEAQCWIEVKAQAWLSERSNAHPVSFGRLATAS